MYYSKTVTEVYHSPETLEAFEVGTNIHLFMDKFLWWLHSRNVIEVKAVEQRYRIRERNKPWFLDATLDARVVEKDNGQEWIYDFKSIKLFSYPRQDGSVFEVPLPKPEHVTQLNLYMWVHGITHGKLIYIEKPSFCTKFITKEIKLKEYVVDYDQALVDKKLDDVDAVYSSIQNKTLPERLKDYPTNWLCSYCDFKTKWCDLNRNPLDPDDNAHLVTKRDDKQRGE